MISSKELLRQMLLIRRVEEAIAKEYPKQEMRCPIHLSIGQEAVPVGLSAHLSKEDHVYSTHRCHAHYLAKGGSIPKMLAELFGKETGCARGLGGSMHLIDIESGMMGSSALVGGTIPLAVGSALSMSLSKRRNVAVAYFGDGGSEEGIFYESMNFAALKKLPVIFAIENNLYATYSHQSARQATKEIHRRGETFGIPGFAVDGNDVLAVFEAAKRAVDRARAGGGPTIFEFQTYRVRDHVGPHEDISVGYRTEAEVRSWQARCPIDYLKRAHENAGELSEAEWMAWENEIQLKIDEAFAFARSSPAPQPQTFRREVYART